MSERHDRLFARADAILDEHKPGRGMPILWHLARRNYGPALLNLSNWLTRSGKREELGRMADAFSPLGMMYRAFRLGEPNAGQHLALTYFNLNDMAGYRYWLHRTAKAGDHEARIELKLFETRKPHALTRKIGRIRPYRKDGS